MFTIQRGIVMKKKRNIIILLCFLIFCIYRFYKPMALSDLVNEQDRLFIVHSVRGIEDELPYINANDYKDITAEETSQIRTNLGDYLYRRSIIHTIFPHSISNEEVTINVFENGEFINTITISTDGYVSINEKIYVMKDASSLIDSLLEIISD